MNEKHILDAINPSSVGLIRLQITPRSSLSQLLYLVWQPGCCQVTEEMWILTVSSRLENENAIAQSIHLTMSFLSDTQNYGMRMH